MVQISLAWLVIGGEVAAALLLGLLVMVGLAVWRQRRDRAATRILVARVKESRGPRVEALRRLLSGRYGYIGERLDQAMADVMRRENDLYRAFIALYHGRDAQAAAGFYERVNAMVEPYHHLVARQAEHEQGELQEQVRKLEDRNERLREELRISHDTMDKMLQEYAQIFEGTTSKEEAQHDLEEMIHQTDFEDEEILPLPDPGGDDIAVELPDPKTGTAR